MTNKEAIDIIKCLAWHTRPNEEDIEQAIEALDQTELNPSYNSVKTELEPCEDCISRKDVIILIDEATELHPYKVIGDSETYSNYNQGWEDACNWLYANIESDNLKNVTPQPKMGHWIGEESLDGSIRYMCDNCKEFECVNYYDYCPNCGAKMEVEDENKTK